MTNAAKGESASNIGEKKKTGNNNCHWESRYVKLRRWINYLKEAIIIKLKDLKGVILKEVKNGTITMCNQMQHIKKDVVIIKEELPWNSSRKVQKTQLKKY